MTGNDLAFGMLWFIAFLFSTTCHEAAHAWAAKRGGDLTAYALGQVTLDPTPHIKREPFGMVVMPWLSYLTAGWMMGWASAPYNPQWARQYPKRSAWMALAGPTANFALVLASMLLMHAGILAGVFQLGGDRIGLESIVSASGGGVAEAAATLLSIFFSLNLLLGTFNLIPFPPLDGFGAIGVLLPEAAILKLMDLRSKMGALSLVGLLLAWRLYESLFTPIFVAGVTLVYLPYR